MTARDDLREEVAKVVAPYLRGTDWQHGFDYIIADAALSVAIPRIEAETREACAKVADDMAAICLATAEKHTDEELKLRWEVCSDTACDIAAAIRNQEPSE